MLARADIRWQIMQFLLLFLAVRTEFPEVAERSVTLQSGFAYANSIVEGDFKWIFAVMT